MEPSGVYAMGAGTSHCSPATGRGQCEWMMLQPPRLLIGPEGGASEPTDGRPSSAPDSFLFFFLVVLFSPVLILVTGHKLHFVCTQFCFWSACGVVDYFGLGPP